MPPVLPHLHRHVLELSVHRCLLQPHHLPVTAPITNSAADEDFAACVSTNSTSKPADRSLQLRPSETSSPSPFLYVPSPPALSTPSSFSEFSISSCLSVSHISSAVFFASASDALCPPILYLPCLLQFPPLPLPSVVFPPSPPLALNAASGGG